MKRISTGGIFIGLTVLGLLFITALVVSTNNTVYSNFKLPLKIVEYFDYACSHCQDIHVTMKRVEEDFKGDVEVEYVYYNLFPQSIPAAYAAEAAREQGKFLEYHNALFAEFAKLQAQDPRVSFEAVNLEAIATSLNLDVAKFNQDRADQKIQARLAEGTKRGIDKGVTGTPSVFINDVMAKLELRGAGDYSPFYDKVQKIINEVKAK
jgi:protein-disulfide isomerase